MKKLFLLLLVGLPTFVAAQSDFSDIRKLSATTRKEFVTAMNAKLKSGPLKTWVESYLRKKYYTPAEISALATLMPKDYQLQDDVLDALFHYNEKYLKSVSDILAGTNLSNKSFTEIINFQAYRGTVKDNPNYPVVRDNKEYFMNTLEFTDSDFYWRIIVTHWDYNLEIRSFPGKKNTAYKNKHRATDTVYAMIKDNTILTKDVEGKWLPGEFFYGKGKFYQINEEGSYNVYFEYPFRNNGYLKDPQGMDEVPLDEVVHGKIEQPEKE
ncbi:hypothetical protein [Chitinophaga sp. Cy-1792]|uniref:hypothetical protein n=1 Tax=Chitinophaga sp. Cy-1792 TaxID=2608339 RepID=UPI001423BC31|nr:hypothetical protein [Chitinophaga sp. Cy-1792]NIG56293.1 hypothetical protein [Chitinophaga sp. Cy-1792]